MTARSPAADLVELDHRAAVAYGLPFRSPPGRYWLTDDGETVRVEEDGRVELLIRGGAPWGRSIASCPDARRGWP